MQSETRETHISRLSRFVKTSKNALDLGDQCRWRMPAIPFLEQSLKPSVAKAKDHAKICNLSLDSLQHETVRRQLLSGT